MVWDFAIRIEKFIGECINNSLTAATFGADEGNILTTTVRESLNHLVDYFVARSLINGNVRI